MFFICCFGTFRLGKRDLCHRNARFLIRSWRWGKQIPPLSKRKQRRTNKTHPQTHPQTHTYMYIEDYPLTPPPPMCSTSATLKSKVRETDLVRFSVVAVATSLCKVKKNFSCICYLVRAAYIWVPVCMRCIIPRLLLPTLIKQQKLFEESMLL